MTSRSSGNDGGLSVYSLFLFDTSMAGAVCGGCGAERVFSLCCLAQHRDIIVLSSIQMIFSASIGMDVTVTGTVVLGSDFLTIGDGV